MEQYISKLALMVLLTLLFAQSTPTRAHTHIAPDGTVVTWYPKACCDDQDCRSVQHRFVYDPTGKVTHVLLLVAGEWEKYPIAWAKLSRDHLAHWCGLITRHARRRLATMRCFFVPKGHAGLPPGRSWSRAP